MRSNFIVVALIASLIFSGASSFAQEAGAQLLLAMGENPGGSHYAEGITAEGRILGSAIGEARATASIFVLELYGPDDQFRLQARTQFDENRGYRFEHLPEGRYWIRIYSAGPSSIEAILERPELTVTPGVVEVIDVVLR